MPILTPQERVGECVAGRYRITAVLSTGGMGVLFEARDEGTDQRVAVKMLKPAYALEPDRVARFERESRIATRLRHPNITVVLDLGSDADGSPFLVMELLQGRSLAQELEERRVLPIGEASAIALRVATALAAAHAMGVLHRDVKPANIFLARNAPGGIVPKLLDFGIATSAEDDFATQTGLVMGTPGYMAPERVLHGECGPFTDIWGIGAVLYRCVMGHSPHAADSVSEALRRLVREPVPPVAAEGVGKAIGATIDRALAREPHRRYPSMAAFARALEVASDAGEEATTEFEPALELPTAARATSLADRDSWPQSLDGEAAVSVARVPPPGPRRRALAWIGVALAAGGLTLALRHAQTTRAPAMNGSIDNGSIDPLIGVPAPEIQSVAGSSASASNPPVDAPLAEAPRNGPTSPRAAPPRSAGSSEPRRLAGRLEAAGSQAARKAPSPGSWFEPATGLPVVTEW
jgi:serine/threonine protein kinase